MTRRGQIRSQRGLTNSHDDIDRAKLFTHSPEYFSHGALDQGARNRARSGMPANYDSQTRPCARQAVPAQYDKKFALPPRGECTGELRLAAKPRFAGKALARRL
jgi:hypothetical protein